MALDHEQQKQALRAEQIRESMSKRELRLTALQLAIATQEKLVGGGHYTEPEKAHQDVLTVAKAYLEFMDPKASNIVTPH